MATSTIKAISEDITSSINSTKVRDRLYAYKNGRMVTFSVSIEVTLTDSQQVISDVFTSNKPINVTACNLASGTKNNPTGINAFLQANGSLVLRGTDSVSNKTYYVSGSFITSGG